MRAFILPADRASLDAAYRLGTEFYRLVLDAGPAGAIDLAHRYEEEYALNPQGGTPRVCRS